MPSVFFLGGSASSSEQQEIPEDEDDWNPGGMSGWKFKSGDECAGRSVEVKTGVLFSDRWKHL